MSVVMVRYPSVLDELEPLVESYDEECFTNELEPSMNLVEDKDELIARFELPGMRKDDIDITVDGRTLLVKGEKKSPEFSEGAKYYTCEQCFGSYARSVELPFDVKPDKISSRFEDGILEIRLPRTEESKPRHITIGGGKKQIGEPVKSK
jgi:HSP20 family molecular chaperone IbpA